MAQNERTLYSLDNAKQIEDNRKQTNIRIIDSIKQRSTRTIAEVSEDCLRRITWYISTNHNKRAHIYISIKTYHILIGTLKLTFVARKDASVTHFVTVTPSLK